ncbi:MAG: chemotaxis protein CheD [Dehalococcoidales bacterium]
MTTTQQTTASDQTISVGLGEVKVTSDASMYLACFGLGSCICLCAYDTAAKIAGMAHIVLPESKSKEDMTATKYADIAVPVLFEEMIKKGASKSKLIIKLAGGAQMIQAPGFATILDMGAKNLVATRAALKSSAVRVSGEDIGGSKGRSVWLSVATGETMVRTAGREYNKI